MVVLRGIPFESHCEHHLAPIIGRAWVAYVPDRRVVGISKLARVVVAYARRLQIQERLTAQIANTIAQVLNPQGVGVVLKAAHHCISSRGVHIHGTDMVTSRMLGASATIPPHARNCSPWFTPAWPSTTGCGHDKRAAVAYLVALAVFLGCDMVWLGLMAPRFYRPTLGDIAVAGVNLPPAIVFYAMYPIGLLVFAIQPALKSGSLTAAALYGALFGLFTYATYDLTNQATLRNWTLALTVVDVSWGAVSARSPRW